MIYAIHHHNTTGDDDTVSPLEAFPSVERASVALQLRARKQESGTYYAFEDNSETPRPVVAFPKADLTGYMLVWRRKATEDRPAPMETPEEVWRLTPGGAVVKEPYDPDNHPASQPPKLTPEERRTKALKALAEVPPLTEEFRAELDPMWKRVLRDLVQDEEAEDAILRVMQMNWTADRK